MIDFPEKLAFLFEPARYKVAFGGRAGLKSWSFARALLIQGSARGLRVLCARETQKSIADSVHKLLTEQIDELGLRAHYTVEKARIIGINGTEFIFDGLKHNINNIKSKEGIDIVWVEEAQTVSKTSWEVLIPTIRKEGSEIWVSFNPELESDDTYKRWVLKPPPGAVVVKTSFRDNPWLSAEMKNEIRYDRERDEDSYLHVWEGNCKRMLEGAVYANELRAAESAGRITRVPYDPTKPVHTFWDIGWGDLTAIWFAQMHPFEYRLIDYLEDSQKSINHYLGLLQTKPYVYGNHYLPWDGGTTSIQTGRSIKELMAAKGMSVEVMPQMGTHDGINAVRTIFSQCYFDADHCEDGLQSLRHYRYEVDEKQPVLDGRPVALSRKPVHNWASHGADAFRTFGVMAQTPEREQEHVYASARPRYGSSSWMA